VSVISKNYVLITFITGLTFFLVYFFKLEQSTVRLIFIFLFVYLLIVLSIIDLYTFRLPDALVFPLIFLSLISSLVTHIPVFINGFLGALIISIMFFSISVFFPKAMGFGDVKLVAALGLFLGIPYVFMAIFLACFLGAAIGGIRILVSKKGIKDPIPFGPFLAAGSILSIILFT
jgi:leader peptidase (prepilin peptidase)/N-methyltransferase